MVNKNYQVKEFEESASKLGAKDKEFVSVTEGGVPQTKPEEISSKVRKFYQPAVQLVAAPFQALGNALIPGGAPFGKDNPMINSQKDRDARAAELASMKTYREKRDMVRDNVVNIIHTAKQKNPNMGSEMTVS